MDRYQIPSLTALALQYGTITPEQSRHIHSLETLHPREDDDGGDLLIAQKFATRYQVELLRLIHDYLVIKKSGEEFGRIAVEKEYATPAEVKDALAVQRESFRKSRLKKMIGDILVTAAVISPDQKDEILTEQADLEREAHRILAPSPTQG
ncbi:MAG: hypothetical protein MI747_02715, partial [Desulfobacterales bacterium]|nr:hypothetical protein [Desulfobacterales bacterium]